MDSSSSSSTASTSTFNLTMAASLMAVFAFYIYKHSVDQVLNRLIEIHRKPPFRFTTEEDDDEEDDQEQHQGFGLDREIVIDQKTMSSRFLDEKLLPTADMRSGGLIEKEAKYSSSKDDDEGSVLGAWLVGHSWAEIACKFKH